VIDIVLQQPRVAPESRVAPAARCCIARCTGAAMHLPILRIALLGSERVSRIALPAHLCAGHRDGFADRFLTPARRATIEASLRSRGRSPPDWSRTEVEFA
jgi:hypothetical protein